MAMEKHKMMVQLLANRTESGGVTWKTNPQEKSFQTSLKENLIIIQEEISDRSNDYWIYICDAFGEVIDSFSDNDLSAEGDPGTPPDFWFRIMRDLYHAARRIASGSDRALSLIIEELGG